jgi:phosphate ABC transporter phosphate-binding protein
MEEALSRRSQIRLPQAGEVGPRRRGAGWLKCLTGIACIALFHATVATPSARASGKLDTIQTLQVASMGDGASADAMRARIVDRLKKSGRLHVVEGPADLILRGTSSIWATGTITLHPHSKAAVETIYQGYLSLELVDRSNQTLWSYLVTPSRFHTASITDDLADHATVHLLDALASGAAGSPEPASAAAGSLAALRAAGSTLAAPLYRKWFQSSGVNVTYDAIGSEAGIERLEAGKVDFAASDMPIGEQDKSGQHALAPNRVTQIPTVAGGVVPIYNLPELGRGLRLTPELLAGIYAGTIRKWNNPRILEANRGARLPDAEIAVVHRSDGSGTTYVWTSFLALVSLEWNSNVGAGPHVEWPTGVGAEGNNGVADLVEKTPHSIGYVELIYAIQHELNYAAVRNPAGEFIKADLASITAAASSAGSPPGDRGFPFSILNAPSRDAYPISTFTWLLIPVEGLSAEKKSAIASLLNWMLTTGQKECASLGYAPLPREIAARALQAASALKEMSVSIPHK